MKRIVDDMDRDLQGQALARKNPEGQHHNENIPAVVQLLVVFDLVEKLCLMQEKKQKLGPQLRFESLRSKKHKVGFWIKKR